MSSPAAARQAARPPQRPADPRLRASYLGREGGDRQFVAALARGLAILRCFRSGDRYLGNQELAQRTGLPKPTVARLTHTLTRLGFLTHSPAREAYALGAGVLALGHAYLAALSVRAVAWPLMQELAEYAHATVALAENDNERMVVVEICHGSPAYRLRLDVGQRVPHNTTALGRAFLAAQPPEVRAERIQSLCRALPAEERAQRAAEIERSLREHDRLGFVYSWGEWNPQFFAAGAPLVSADRTRVLSLSCSGPLFELTRKRLLTEIGPRVVQLRDRIYEAVHGYF